MTAFFYTSNIITGPAAIVSTAFDSHFILAGVTIGSTGNDAIQTTAGGIYHIDGRVAGQGFGLYAGTTSNTTTVNLSTTGHISGNTGIGINGPGQFQIAGRVVGANVGIAVSGANASEINVSSTGFVSGTNGISVGSSSVIDIDGRVDGSNKGIVSTSTNAIIDLNVGSTGHVSGGNGNEGINLICVRARIVNSGLIEANGSAGWGVAINSLSTSVILNNGSIIGFDRGIYNIGGSALILENFGTISSAGIAYTGSATGEDNVKNGGTIVGAMYLLGGADSYDGRNGHISGAVLGGIGNDTLFGGRGADQLFGEGDSDSIYFDAEDLTYGVVSGGAGYDIGYYTDNTTPITINLTTQGFEAYYGSAADELVFSGSLGGFGAFARFGAGNDTWDGSAQADNVDGGTGVDVLYGRGGADVIAGGNGGDWLSGGAGADTFDYNSLTDSTVSASDYISDFSSALGDKIDLSGVTFGLATFNTGYGTGTSVYIYPGGGGTTLVQVYSGATLDMQIVVNQASLAVGDFVL